MTYLIKDDNDNVLFRTDDERLKNSFTEGLRKANITFTVEELNYIKE